MIFEKRLTEQYNAGPGASQQCVDRPRAGPHGGDNLSSSAVCSVVLGQIPDPPPRRAKHEEAETPHEEEKSGESLPTMLGHLLWAEYTHVMLGRAAES